MKTWNIKASRPPTPTQPPDPRNQRKHKQNKGEDSIPNNNQPIALEASAGKLVSFGGPQPIIAHVELSQ